MFYVAELNERNERDSTFNHDESAERTSLRTARFSCSFYLRGLSRCVHHSASDASHLLQSVADCPYRQRLKTTALVFNTKSKQLNTVVSGDESEIHDEPHIRDRRITVSHIHALVEERDLDAQTVADRFDLTVSDVYHALAYYHDHPEEMWAVEERRRERHEAADDDPSIITGPDDLPESS